MSDIQRPARPGTGVTHDGRRLRVRTTYARRGSRLGPTQQAAWDRNADRWLIPEAAIDEVPFDVGRHFGREAPLIVEIGSGNGEAVAALARSRPAYDVLALEVWTPGVASTFLHLEAAGVENVRLLSVDAVWCLEHLFGPGQLHGLWTFFPDPWPKTKHHRRRLVGPKFAEVAASRLARGAEWRLATDWPDYADQVDAVLGAQPMLEGGRTERWDERPMTKFERRGIAEGRPSADFCYRRIG